MMTAEAQQVFRDEWLGGHQMSAPDQVRQASAQFYAALNHMAAGDASAMRDIWVDSADATALHPIGGRDAGSEQVLAAFAQVASLASGGHIRLTDQVIQVGEDLAYEVGNEEGDVTLAGEQVTVNHRVTNIYRYADGEWKMIHHHTDAAPAMQALLKRLQQSA
jgi:ketosteroid isomerase-like protein